jgi:hypothetical protein
MSSNQGTGNINYSFDISNIYNTIKSHKGFLFNYYLSILISLIYLYTIRVKRYIYDEFQDYNIESYFKTITLCFPNDIMKAEPMKSNLDSNHNNTGGKTVFYGLTKRSYVIIISLYLISILIIISEYSKNSLFNILTTFIQLVKNNNPYNNPNMVTKSKNNNNTEYAVNNSKIFGLLLIFFVPFLIPYFLKLFGFDNYDVKKNVFAGLGVCILLLYPFIFVLFSKIIFGKHLDLLNGIDKYIETKDIPYINKITDLYKFKSFLRYALIFIILVYVYYLILHFAIDGSTWKKKGFIFFILLFFIPFILIYDNLEIIFSNFSNENFSSTNVEKYLKNGCNNLLGLIIKYNYSCIKK